MQEDNAYPNNGRFYQPEEPSAQKKDLEAEIEAILEQVPVLKEVIQHFNDQIVYYDSISSIDADLNKSPAVHQREVRANKAIVKKLRTERTWILGKIQLLKK